MTRPTVFITKDQADVLAELAVDGADDGQIAERLGVSREVVRYRIKGLYFAFGVRNRTELVVAHLRQRVALEIRERRRRQW